MGRGYQGPLIRSNSYCQICGTVFTVWRPKAHKRPHNHVKHLYCVKCKEVTAHQEERGNHL